MFVVRQDPNTWHWQMLLKKCDLASRKAIDKASERISKNTYSNLNSVTVCNHDVWDPALRQLGGT